MKGHLFLIAVAVVAVAYTLRYNFPKLDQGTVNSARATSPSTSADPTPVNRTRAEIERRERRGEPTNRPAVTSRAAQPSKAPANTAQDLDRLRASFTAEYGVPKRYAGRILQHFDGDSLFIHGADGAGDFVLDAHPDAVRLPDGEIIWFNAWRVDQQSYTTTAGASRTMNHMIYAVDALPRWDKYGRPINRNGVETQQEIRASEVHSLDPR
jgi:hypothetical protein